MNQSRRHFLTTLAAATAAPLVPVAIQPWDWPLEQFRLTVFAVMRPACGYMEACDLFQFHEIPPTMPQTGFIEACHETLDEEQIKSLVRGHNGMECHVCSREEFQEIVTRRFKGCSVSWNE